MKGGTSPSFPPEAYPIYLAYQKKIDEKQESKNECVLLKLKGHSNELLKNEGDASLSSIKNSKETRYLFSSVLEEKVVFIISLLKS